MKNEIEQALHEKLCAYILGEADEATRAEVERALEASADLRAGQARLEKTIGLVQSTLAEGESLSESAVAQMVSAASAPRRRPWYAIPAVRLAAGIGVIAIGLGVYATMEANHTTDELCTPRDRSEMKEKLASASERRSEPAPASQPSNEPAATAKIANVEVTGDADSSYHTPADSVPPSGSMMQAKPTNPVTVDTLARLDDLGKKAEAKSSGEASMPADGRENENVVLQVGDSANSTAIGVGTSGAPAKAGESSSLGFSAGRIGRQNPAPGGERRLGGALPPSAASRPAPSAPSVMAPGGGVATGGPAGAAGPSGPSTPEQLKRRKVEALLGGLGYAGDEKDHSSEDLSMGLEGRGTRQSDFFAHDDTSLAARLQAMTPAQRDEYVDLECKRILLGCRRRPNERPRDMFFRFYGDNAFEYTALDALSTFSVDVDTSSYALARRYLAEGHIPGKEQIRTEEFVNYFKADVAAPTKGVFAIHTDLAPSRFGTGDGQQRSMLRVVVRGREIAKQERKPLNLTFVIDVSGSMREQNRLEMVKHAIRLLVDQLDARDRIALVAFSQDARTVLQMTSAAKRAQIESALFPLEPEQSTNSEAGLKLGYSIALANLSSEANNRVVFLSDGVANVGETDPGRLSDAVKPIREMGIYLNTIGVGMNNHNDALLEQLADKGDGVSNYVDTPAEARRAIVDNFTGAFETIARDVKIQVEFDPAQVLRYRLLGYENRAIADQDFRNDKVDAGEVGAGHQVTALYEIERQPNVSEKPLATVRLRWKAPRNVNAPQSNEEATEIAQPVLASQQTGFEGAGPAYRRAVIVAQFAEILRRSVHAKGDSLDDAIAEAKKLRAEIRDPEFDELCLLMEKSRQLVLDALPTCDDLCQTIETVRRNELLRCQKDLLATADNAKAIEELERDNAKLEARIRELIRQRIDKPRVR